MPVVRPPRRVLGSQPCASSSPGARSVTRAGCPPSLPEALRLLMLKSDGSVMVHADTGGFKPQNWMTPPTVIEEEPGLHRRAQEGCRGPDRDPHRRGALGRDARHGRGGRAREGGRRAGASGAPGRRAARGAAADAARVAHGHRAGRSHVPRRERRVRGGGDQAHRHHRRGGAAHEISGADLRRAGPSPLSWSARRATDQAAGTHACRGPRHRVCGGRRRGAEGRARARPDVVRGSGTGNPRSRIPRSTSAFTVSITFTRA